MPLFVLLCKSHGMGLGLRCVERQRRHFSFLKMLPFCCPVFWANCTLPISGAVNCSESRFRCGVVTFGAQGRSPPLASDVGEHGVGHTHAWGCECVLSSPCLPFSQACQNTHTATTNRQPSRRPRFYRYSCSPHSNQTTKRH